nr:putative late blight resistance protein homolog R1B-13 [Nicotiana tomentosiformis]
MCVIVEETEFGVGEIVSTLRLPYANAFPKILKKLTLQNTFVPWEDIRTVSKLPKLEVLKLKIYSCRGTVWETIEDGFPQLKFLLLNGTDLALWKTNSDHFPCLECLVLGNCDSLHSIPQDFADVTTLQLIELNMCKLSIVDSTRSWRQRLRRSCQKSNIPGGERGRQGGRIMWNFLGLRLLEFLGSKKLGGGRGHFDGIFTSSPYLDLQD